MSKNFELSDESLPKSRLERRDQGVPDSVFSPEVLVELLDPALWRPALENYARTTHIAIQLFDASGNPVIECVNAQASWTLLRSGTIGDGKCIFSTNINQCQCLADAFHLQKNVFVRDSAGLVHFALPLFLEGNAVGALLAGQVFDEPPQSLPLERAAQDAHLSIQDVWLTSRQAHPVAMDTLEVYTDLLFTLAMSILQARYKDILASKELRKAMKLIESSLAEKEALLQEVHHRVKNNLQVISSLLGLKAHQIKDEGVVKILEEMRQRVQSIAVIHESLYRSNSFAAIDFVANARDLGESLLRFYGLESSVQIEVQARGITELPITVAVPCSLLLNELLSNALKHAFVGREGGTILINIREKERTYDLEVTDNGVGIPQGFRIGTSPSFGLQLVDLLASQLAGIISIKSDSCGTTVHLSFPAAVSRRGPEAVRA